MSGDKQKTKEPKYLELLNTLTNVLDLSRDWMKIANLPALLPSVKKQDLFQCIRRSEALKVTRTKFIGKNWYIKLRNKYFTL